MNICIQLKNVSKICGKNRVTIIHSHKLSTKSMEQSDRAVNEAEKLVGYPTSFLNLRWLLNDEVANVAIHLKKLIGTKHPLVNTARELLLNKETPSWGLLVLLISKAGGLSNKFSKLDCDINAGILHSQRVLAEITEMVRTSNIIHNSVLNISSDDEFKDDLHFGNKLSLLTGDYLLSNSFKELAALKCHPVNELVSTSLRDLTEASFIEPRDSQNRPLPASPLSKQKEPLLPHSYEKDLLKMSEVMGNVKAEWTLRHLLGGGTLLGKCCQASLMLADHPEELEKAGYLFGRNIALALQIRKDISQYNSGRNGSFSLINAPLMFHIQDNPEYYENLMVDVEDDSINYNRIRNVVSRGKGIEKSLELQEEFIVNGRNALRIFPESSTKQALDNILQTI
ncbi:all trans-polyprenyl-diphosphate synthase PDSS2-like [Diorhabda carinulata]|uniref:all trans-polyprenyl-diphosphate synthase PDSS2-like n=1 Tax=Diorhabda carinulata TaxID=1163345 RepID=UPI0025A00F0B|nr:all trans-polyprenyl-diphosphate synthase PDSS2-like [Diorhabda carinulata]